MKRREFITLLDPKSRVGRWPRMLSSAAEGVDVLINRVACPALRTFSTLSDHTQAKEETL
jgi:hypothetical protein